MENVKPMSPGELAERFGVDPKTISRWAKSGKIPSFRTLGGHRRFHLDKVEAAIEKMQATA